MFIDYDLKENTQKLKICLSVLGFTLFLTGCATSRPTPAFIQSPGGNSWVVTIPAGSKIQTDKDVMKPAFNEIKDGVLLKDCVLVSPSYIQLRDERELELLKVIEEWGIKQ